MGDVGGSGRCRIKDCDDCSTCSDSTVLLSVPDSPADCAVQSTWRMDPVMQAWQYAGDAMSGLNRRRQPLTRAVLDRVVGADELVDVAGVPRGLGEDGGRSKTTHSQRRPPSASSSTSSAG